MLRADLNTFHTALTFVIVYTRKIILDLYCSVFAHLHTLHTAYTACFAYLFCICALVTIAAFYNSVSLFRLYVNNTLRAYLNA